ncbi:MAG: PAS domain-containing hybrid sensor histidine kinase/response regulator [Thermodesulfobacteriota bacterium]
MSAPERIENIHSDRVFDAMPPVCAINRDFFIFQMNEPFRELFGSWKNPKSNPRCFEIKPDPRCHTSACPLTRVITGDSFEPRRQNVTLPDGRVLSCLEAVRPIQASGGAIEGVTITYIDIGSCKAMEAVLPASDPNFRRRIADIEDGYFEVDPKGNFTYVNDAVTRFFGYNREELLGMNNRQYMDKENAKKVLNRFNSVFATGEAVGEFEFEVITKNGQTRSAEGSVSLMRDAHGNASGFRGIVRDVSKRKMMETALRESEEKYRLVVENATEGIIILQDRLIKYANPRIQAILGYEAGTFRISPLTRFVHPDDQNNLVETYHQILDGKRSQAPFSFRAFSKAGEERILQSKSVLINWEKKPAVLVFLRDMTSQSILESKLQHAQKMEAIGTLAGGIAHDFNNILGSIVLNTELALDDVEKGGEAEYSLEQVLNASQRAKDLVEQILTFSRNAEVTRKPLNIKVIVKETLRMLRAMLPSTIVIRPVIADEVGTILANPTQIQQLVINLCTNAAHAMSEKGGPLEILLENTIADLSEPESSDCHPRKYVKLAVIDKGHGMTPEFKERIFDPFFTTKRIGEGTGLGLSVVHGIVINHEGAIQVDSQPGKGSVFNVFFPIIEDKAPAMVASRKQVPTGNKRILFADDESALLDATQRMLERIGYRVTGVQNGGDAYKIFEGNPDDFDLIITDMTMPYMTGVELAEAILRLRPNMPIILCTGFNERITPEIAKSIGIREYMTKPYALQEIAETIQQVLKETTSPECV